MPDSRRHWGAWAAATVLVAGSAGVYGMLAGATRSGAASFSSLDTQPGGAAALFGSYARAGLSVTRGWDADSIASATPALATAFVIAPEDWDPTLETGLEAFVRGGGRVVLLDAGWAAGNKELPPLEKALDVTIADAGTKTREVGAAQPVPGAMPASVQPMPLEDARRALKPGAEWKALYTSARGPVLAQRQLGAGTLVLATEAAWISNQALAVHPDPVLLAWLTGGRTSIFVDETAHGLIRERGVLWLMARWRLDFALWLLVALLGLAGWWLASSLEQPAPRESREEMARGEASATGWVRLLQRVTPPAELAERCRQRYLVANPGAWLEGGEAGEQDAVTAYNRMRVTVEGKGKTGYE